MDTSNPLAHRPGLGWLGAQLGPNPMPGDFDNNQGVLNQLVSMGAITAQNAADIIAGHLSLDDLPQVTMNVVNSALVISGQQGLPIAVTNPAITNVVANAPIDTSWQAKAGAVLNAVTPTGAPKPPSGWAAFGLTGTTGVIVGAAAVIALLIIAKR